MQWYGWQIWIYMIKFLTSFHFTNQEYWNCNDWPHNLTSLCYMQLRTGPGLMSRKHCTLIEVIFFILNIPINSVLTSTFPKYYFWLWIQVRNNYPDLLRISRLRRQPTEQYTVQFPPKIFSLCLNSSHVFQQCFQLKANFYHFLCNKKIQDVVCHKNIFPWKSGLWRHTCNASYHTFPNGDTTITSWILSHHQYLTVFCPTKFRR